VAGHHGAGYRDILIDGFVPPSTSVAPMFPFYENTYEWDDFGEVINPDDYVIKDEDMDLTGIHVSLYCEIFSSLVAKKFDFGVAYFTVKYAFCLHADLFDWDMISTQELPYLV
jgi:hypothetical protein